MSRSKMIGLVPGSFKPYHAGHDGLIRLASSENDEVVVYSSIADRTKRGEFPLYGVDMAAVMDQFVRPSLPGNVKVEDVRVPVQSVYQTLEEAEEIGSSNVFTIYSDSEDILKYTEEKLAKSAPILFANGQIRTRGVVRGEETPNISGTKMREYLQTGNVTAFSKMLPPALRKRSKEIIDVLSRKISESLLKTYIRLLTSSRH